MVNLRNTIDYLLPKNEMTGHRSLNLFPESFTNILGAMHYHLDCPNSEQVKSNEKYQLVEQVFDRLVKAASEKYPSLASKNAWEIRIKETSTINAYCLPGGKMIITSALLEKLEMAAQSGVSQEDLVAAVLGHEMSHALGKHGHLKLHLSLIATVVVKVMAYVFSHLLVRSPSLEKNQEIENQAEREQVEKEQKKQMKRQRDAIYRIVQFPLNMVMTYLTAKHSQSCEFEADQFGIILADVAQFNPEGAIKLQEMFLEMRGELSWLQRQFDIISSHPPSERRIEENRKTVENLPSRAVS